MKVFVIHRFDSRYTALKSLNALAKKNGIHMELKMLHCSQGEQWKSQAEKAIDISEAVIVFDPKRCEKSPNASWELEYAKTSNKEIIFIDGNEDNCDEIDRLCAIYHHDKDFDGLFPACESGGLELYKIMIQTSENLVQRRQAMNSFFITAIGGLLTIAGALEKFGKSNSELTSFLVMVSFGLAGMFLCNSWRNLIDNYGKLNAAKFRVILRLEKSLPAQIFAAEWTALGKGKRPKKYLSFTSTENLVPLWFATLILGLVMGACIWRVWG